MSTFKAQVLKITIEPHPGADMLELAKIGEYRSIVRKEQFQTGDLAVFIPPAAILPDWIISKLGLEGKLAGSQKNRIKEVKLRGILSEGVIFPVNTTSSEGDIERPIWIDGVLNEATEVLLVSEGDDVTEFLGITKYEPIVPAHMAGEVCNVSGYTLKYDIENWKKFPDILCDDTKVTISEKIHGTNCQFGYVPNLDNPDLIDGNVIVISKGLGAQGLSFKDNEKNASNLYVKTYKDCLEDGKTIAQRIKELAKSGTLSFLSPDTAVYIVGEIFGPGVQSGFTYGLTKPTFLAFDVYVGLPGKGRYLHEFEKAMLLHDLKINRVPILYSGPWSKTIIEKYTSGKETLSGKQDHMREGIVITPQLEYTTSEIGRVILKSVSPEYLTRKGDATEYS